MADPYTLALVQGEEFQLGFRYKPDGTTAEDLTTYSWASQARQKEAPDADLLIDLTPYLALDQSDDTLLWLIVPATATAILDKARDTAAWDLFIWPTAHAEQAELLVQGPCTVDRSTTDLTAVFL